MNILYILILLRSTASQLVLVHYLPKGGFIVSFGRILNLLVTLSLLRWEHGWGGTSSFPTADSPFSAISGIVPQGAT